VGNEITVPILDQKALPVVEIVPPDNEEFDYDNKYNGRSQELCPPLSVPRETQKQAQELAEKVHKTMGCRHLSRVDIMIDKAGKLYVLEINTMPGMTDQSLYPKSALVAGMMMPDLMTKFVELVKRDYSI
jgi:D-alanine-D-alanine ligase